jgi:hypothetical protein
MGAGDYLVLDRIIIGFAGADAQRACDVANEDFTIANAARLRSCCNGFDHALCLFVGYDDFEFNLGQEIDYIFGAAVKLCVTLLAAKAARFCYGDARDADFVERLFHFVEFEGFDDRFDLFHVSCVPICALIVGSERRLLFAIYQSRIMPRLCHTWVAD